MDDNNSRICPGLFADRRNAATGIHPLGRDGALPLSHSQRQLWLSAHRSSSPSHHVTAKLRLRGTLDRPALRAALDRIVARHKVLRTTFPSIEGEPTQVIAPIDAGFALIEQDMESREAIEQVSRQEALDPFDLSGGPLIRGRLLRMPGDDHVLLITLHQIAGDTTSVEVLLRELSELYAAIVLGQTDPLPPLQLQYADYATWQQRQISVDALDEQLHFWKRELASYPAALQLPTDRTRRSPGSYMRGCVQLKLSTALSKRLEQLARRQRVSLFVTLMTGWVAVLSRWCVQEHLIIGTRVDNREPARTTRLVGPFENRLALPISVEQDTTVEQLLKQIKTKIAQANAHKDVPFERVEEAVNRGDRNPLLQVEMVLKSTSAVSTGARLPGLRLSDVTVRTTDAPCALSLAVGQGKGGLVGTLEYDCELFERLTVERIAACWEVVLKGMVKHVRRPVSRLAMLTTQERLRVLFGYNETARAYPQDRLVHELFEQQVARTPNAVAVMYEGCALTYLELNRRANQLARHLRNRGVGPDQLVGVCLERSFEMVIGLLAILKAGGAYVPLDPHYPVERLQYMFESAAPRVLLVQRHLAKRVWWLGDTEVVALDSNWTEIDSYEDGNLDPRSIRLTSRHLAYVIYTSGSTGQPKGAMNEHRAVVNRLLWMQDQYELDQRDRVLQKTPFSFDVSVWEFFWTLMCGAQLIVARPQGHQDPNYLRALIDEVGVTRLHFVPSMLQVFLDQHVSESCASVRQIVCSGEELTAKLQNSVLERLPRVCLSNLYGPTEAAVDVTAWECRPMEHDSRVPIGRPIANIRMYVLDRHLQPVPVGVTGEIYIGGIGVGRGYLNRADLTAERFIPDPFSAEAGQRLYKTGDLGKWRLDGALEYLGRNDHQVKIRGFRIELGEIETQLAHHAHVKEAVVIAWNDAGEKRLVAYLTCREDRAVGVDELRRHLQAVLPEHMVPSAFVQLERLPLSPNGKLDRRALPPPDLSAYTTRPYEPPQGEIEQTLVNIWQQLLRVERVGRHDNFFELGGHSLLLVQMMERLRHLGLSADVRRVFESRSLSDLASIVETGAQVQLEVPPNLILPGCLAITPQMLTLVALEPEHIERIVQAVPGGASNIQDIYPLAPLQEGMLFHHLLDGERGGTYVLGMLLSVASPALLTRLIAALQSVINRHDALRTAVLWDGLPQPVQVVYRTATLPVEHIDLDTQRDAGEQTMEWLEPGRRRFDLHQAPLLRLQVAAASDGQRWHVLLQVHHLICDNESLETLLAEVRAHIEAVAPDLPVPVLYRHHVADALAYVRSSDVESFFRSKLGDVDESTAPFGLNDVHGDGDRTHEARQSLEADLARRVRSQARRLGVSAATMFHAAWALLIARASGRDDVVFGTVLLGRLQGNADIQRTLGMFINTLPLRLRLRSLTVCELVEHTHRELVDLLAHEQASLMLAQRCSGVSGPASLFTALLNYRHSPAGAAGSREVVPGVQLLSLVDRTNYPFTLSVDDVGEGFVVTAKTDRDLDPHRVLGYVSTVMHSLVGSLERAPQTLAQTLAVLPETEWRTLIHSFNPSSVSHRESQLLHEVFQEQVRRTPQSAAVMDAGQWLTYAELNTRANQLARHLRARGVGPDQLVGLCTERCIDLIVGLMGIWKAGGAYVPLDPDYPSERSAYVLSDAAPRVLLIQEHLRERLPEISQPTEVIALDSEWPQIAANAGDDLDTGAIGLQSHHLAYVIYTSGSTGSPKGVMVEHRNVVSLWESLEHLYGESAPCERVAVNASFNFDASVKQIVQLLSGRTLLLVPQHVRWDASMLLEFIRAHRIDCIDCTPSQLRAWIAAGLLERHGGAPRMVLVGGEPIDPQLWSHLAQCTETDFYNVYGPTESTVDTTVAHLNGDEGGAPHIGRVMKNRRVYLLDGAGQPVPLGVAGEICIGGAGVARGYLHRPQLTSDRFVRDPFSGDPQARMYRSGDLGRWREDGTIEYAGRNDHQVKIRGFRIEPGEIEAQLTRHQSINEAAVVPREDPAGERQLVAYVTGRGQCSPEPDELRRYLKLLLPEYMVPSSFCVLESLPLTPSGKIDRRSLPEPQLMAQPGAGYEAPQGEVEEVLAAIWQQLLRREHVGRHDNFFDLGGHSLSAMQMIVRVRSMLLVDVPIGLLFRFPTLGRLAAEVDALIEERLHEEVADAGSDVEALLEELAGMPDAKVRALVQDRIHGGKR